MNWQRDGEKLRVDEKRREKDRSEVRGHGTNFTGWKEQMQTYVDRMEETVGEQEWRQGRNALFVCRFEKIAHIFPRGLALRHLLALSVQL